MRTCEEIRDRFALRENLDAFREFYLVGIGGASLSGLAGMLKDRGLGVAGSDANASVATRDLDARGIPVRIGHSGEGIRHGQALVLSDAIDLDTSPEVAEAKLLGCPLFRRSQLLGWLLRGKKVLAVAGSHGKTSTTGMLGCALLEAGLDPTIVVGARVPQWGSSVVEGRGEYAVVEACEAYDGIRDLDPFIVLLTNLEWEHRDFHKSYEALRRRMLRFVDRASALVYCSQDSGARDIASSAAIPHEAYGEPVDFPLATLGAHNKLNAAGAFAVCRWVGISSDIARRGIGRFQGAERRLQVLQDGPVTVVDDYAHHPTEIAASLSALRGTFPGRRLVVAFQPHLYSRTAGAYDAFARALDGADLVFLTDIYPAREEPLPGVSSARIAELMTQPVRYVPARRLLPREVAASVEPGDVVAGMGAGNIGEFAPELVQELGRGAPRRVAVVYGGDSAEREVSIHSGRTVARALEKKGYDVRLIDVSDLLLGSGDLSEFVGPSRPDVAFLAVHGTRAEDGALQGLFELLHIPYTGSGIQASALAMNKALTKDLLLRAGLRVPRGELLADTSQLPTLQPPVVVKPNAQGSTVGLSFVKDPAMLPAAIHRAFQYDSAVLVEEWIEGMETSTPVLGARALPPVEIAPKSGRYDFASKYEPGATEEIVPARLPRAVLDRLQEIALRAHRALGCEGATRTDVMVRGDDLIVLEVNTLPGMTATSLLPNSALAAGISYEELVDWMVQDAVNRYAQKT